LSSVVIATQHGAVVQSCDKVLPWGELDPGSPLFVAGEVHGRAFLPAMPYDDLSLMGWVLEPWTKPDDLSFRSLARWLNIELPSYEGLVVGETVPGQAVLADTARRLYQYLRLHLEQQGLWAVYEQVDRPVALVLRKMEAAGVPVIKGTIDLGVEQAQTRKQWNGWPARWTSLSGRVHPRWCQTGAVTGRLTAQAPSLQSLPRRLRHSVSAPLGRLLVAADLSGADFRMAAALSGDPAMLRLFKQGEDPYTVIGGGAGREARGKERQVGKQIALAALYGASPWTLSRGLQLSVVAVERALGHYRARFPRLWQWRDELLNKYRAGQEHHNPFGRRLAPETEAQAINHPCQSAVADVMKLAMIRLDHGLPTGAVAIAQIHDELLVECDGDDAVAVATIMMKEMTRQLPELPVPLAAKVGVGRTWKEAVQDQG
jgi:DNA polymerase I-like protein with 3'-5' exonuclease and polymerase domains